VLSAYVVWMLCLPMWPSQDGPVHLYYAGIFGKLLGHTDPSLQQYFRIKHLLPPYALYYYALIGLSKIVSPLLADRLVVCCYLVAMVLGFRFVAKKLGPSGESTTLLATLLLLNWPLGMGFVNYCLALSFALWGLGMWLRFGGPNDLWMRAGFVVLAFVTMLTHPVPLALMLGVCAALFLVDAGVSRARGIPRSRPWERDVVTLIVSGLTLIYIKLFTMAHPLQAVLPETGTFTARVIHRAARLAREDGMAVLFGPLPAIRIYRLALMILLVACVAVGVCRTVKSLRQRRWSAGDTICILGLILFMAMPFIPLDLNGLFYFADRLPLLVWLALLLGASRSTMLPESTGNASAGMTGLPWVRIAVILFAVVANGAVLSAANSVIRPISRNIAAVERAPVTAAKKIGFIMEDPREPGGTPNVPSWNPYYWAAVHVVRHNDAVLANAPWMDETILPVGPGVALPEQKFGVLQTPVPTHVYRELLAAPEQRLGVMETLDFVVVQQYNRPAATASSDPMTALERDVQVHWSCQDGAADWYRICQRQ
jgi:hypothetical protein